MPPLRFRADGGFTIAQLTDLHYRNGEPEDIRTLRLMGDVLDSENPDLVVLTGDIIDGGFCRDALRSITDVMRPIVDRRLPWAAVFGNHDDEGSATRGQLMQAMQQLPGCLASPGPVGLSGVGNYTLAIHLAEQPRAMLYFLDSHGYADRSGKVNDKVHDKVYDWIKPDQIDWFLRLPRYPSVVQSLMFFHIPLPEYDQVWTTGHCVGEKNEAVCCPPINSGMFAALKSAGDVHGVFVGHDHVNDYSGELDGIHLCYGRATGFSTYGRPGFARGARMIRLSASIPEFHTWHRLDRLQE